MGTYLGIKHYPHISLTLDNCFYWALYATNYTLPECLLLFHYCLHTLNMTLLVRAEEFISLQSFMFVSTSVDVLVDSTTICMPLIIHWPRLFVVVFNEVYCLHISQYDEVLGVIGLYLFAKFHIF